jgi:hypothetical protein
MKSAHQIANECNMQWQQIANLIKNEGFVPAKKKGRFNYYDKYQVDIMHNILYFNSMIKEVTFESEMNKENFNTNE